MGRWLQDGVRLMDWQQDVARSLCGKRRALYTDATGNGKCVPGDVRVHYNGGYPRIDSLVPDAGDGFTAFDGTVLSVGGSEEPTDFFYKEGHSKYYVAECESGRPVKGTGKHRVLAIRGGGYTPEMIRMDDLHKGDYVLRPHTVLPNLEYKEDFALMVKCILYGSSALSGYECTQVGMCLHAGDVGFIGWVTRMEDLYCRNKADFSYESWESNGRHYMRMLRSDSVLRNWPVHQSFAEEIFALSARYRFCVLLGMVMSGGMFDKFDFLELKTFDPGVFAGMSSLLESLNISYTTDCTAYRYSGGSTRLPVGTMNYRCHLTRRGMALLSHYMDVWGPGIVSHTGDLYSGVFNRFPEVSETRYLSHGANRIRLSKEGCDSLVKTLRAHNRRYWGKLPLRLLCMSGYIKSDRTLSIHRVYFMIGKYRESGAEVPEVLLSLAGYDFDRVVLNPRTEEGPVYDLSVPTTHLFWGQGCVNHNTITCLYSAAYLLSKEKIHNVVVLLPRNGYQKRVWPKEMESKTHLRYLEWEDFADRVGRGVSVDSILSEYHVIVGKHGVIKSDFKLMRELYSTNRKILTILDEAHAFQNPKTALTSTASIIFAYSYGVWGITATTLSKNCENIYHLLNFVYPKCLGSFFNFRERFCKVQERVVGRNPDGSLRKVKEIVDWKDPEEFRNHVRGVLVIGQGSLPTKIHFVDYTLNAREEALYQRVADGIMLDDCGDDASWISRVLSRDSVVQSSVRSVKELDRHSSRFIYLQSVVDGSLNDDGTFGFGPSSKCDALLDVVRGVASRGESILVYCEYYTTLDNVKQNLLRSGIVDHRGTPIVVVEQSSRNNFKSGLVTKEKCDRATYVVLCSPGASESENYFYINNVLLYDMPLTPKGYLQMIGRITRRSTLYPDNLNTWIMRSPTIDLYKLHLTGFKVYMQGAASYDIENFPKEYVKSMLEDKVDHLALAKKVLLWQAGRLSKTRKARTLKERLEEPKLL